MNTKKITKAVIPCGGLGTRFLPITKAVAKEMLPIIDKPVLDYIIDELVASGITDVMLIVSPGKDIIKTFYNPNGTLNERLLESGKNALVEKLKTIETKINIQYAVQVKPKGSGDAIALAEEFVNGEPFVVALGDDVMYNDEYPVTKQLIDVYNEYGRTIFGVQSRPVPEICKYGVIDKLEQCSPRVVKMRGIIEKPPVEKLTSNLATLGRYVVESEVFEVLKRTPVGKGGELQFTDALNTLVEERGGYAYDFIGRRYDMGDKFESVTAVVEFAMRNPEFGDKVKDYIKNLKI